MEERKFLMTEDEMRRLTLHPARTYLVSPSMFNENLKALAECRDIFITKIKANWLELGTLNERVQKLEVGAVNCETRISESLSGIPDQIKNGMQEIAESLENLTQELSELRGVVDTLKGELEEKITSVLDGVPGVVVETLKELNAEPITEPAPAPIEDPGKPDPIDEKIKELRAEGLGYGKIAEKLNELGLKSDRGLPLTKSGVRERVKRLGCMVQSEVHSECAEAELTE